MPEPLTIFYAGLILAAAATLQSAIGFGFALIAIPLMVSVLGLDPEDSIAMVTVCSMGQAMVSGWHLRKDIPWKLLIPMAVVGWLFIVPGMMTLQAIKSLSKDQVNQVFGGIVLFALLITTIGRIKPRENVPTIFGYIAVSFGAFMGGLSGMSGPPIVIWVMAHQWPNRKIRGTLFALFGCLNIFILALLPVQFGTDVLQAELLGLFVLPLVAAGTWCGLHLGHRIPKEKLRIVAMVMLSIMSIKAIVQPMLSPSDPAEPDTNAAEAAVDE